MGDMLKLGPVPVEQATEGASWDGKGQRDIYQIFISYDSDMVVGLQVQYVDEASSSLVLSNAYGKMSGDNFRAIKFDYPSEYITWLKIDGSWNPAGVGFLAFKTNLGKCYGPFPVKRHNKLDDNMLSTGYYLGDDNQFGGFHGTADIKQGLRSLGVYLQPITSLGTTVADKPSPVDGEEAFEIE